MSGISDAITISGRLVDLVKAGATIEAQEQIASLRLALSDAKIELSNLREEVAELKRIETDRQHLKFEGWLYWREGPDGKEGPFCQRCFDVDAKVVRLQPNLPGMAHKWVCVACSSGFQGA